MNILGLFLAFTILQATYSSDNRNYCNPKPEDPKGMEWTGKGPKYQKTISGKICQKWSSQTPHAHSLTIIDGNNHNYCRNPDGEPGIWCYTTDPNTRWELCEQPAICDPRHDVWCGKYTTRHIEVGNNETSTITSTKDTGRCKVVYDMASGATNCTKLEFTCGRFFLPNKDPAKCRRGSKMFVKVDDMKPRVYCDRNKPTFDYPAVADKDFRIWINMQEVYEVDKWPAAGVTCRVNCVNHWL